MLQVLPLPIFFPVVAVLGAFVLHWFSLRPLTTSALRLPACRGAYLGFSWILLTFAWVLYAGFPSQPALFLTLGVTASFVGDYFNLQFPTAVRLVRQPLTLGIAAFLVAQVLYVTAFVGVVSWSNLVDHGWLIPLLVLFVGVPAAVFWLTVYQRDRPKLIMIPAFFYGFFLGTMVAVAVSATLVRSGFWTVVAAGALSFLASDAVMGSTTMKGVHPRSEFQIPWFTYLLAQGLIITGFALVQVF